MLFYLIYFNNFLKFKFLFFNKFFFLKKDQYLQTTLILISSIFLGSWWAEQELSWGGWWSWDFIEIISLNFFFILIFFIHTPKYKNFFSLFEYDLFIKIIIFMIIVRFNFLNSIHNFISNNFFFQFFYELLFFYLLVSLLLSKYKFFFLNLFNFKKNLNYMFILFFLLIFNLFVYLYLEFMHLLYKDISLTGIFKKNKILYYLIMYIYIIFLFKNFNINIFFISFFELIYNSIFFYNNYKNIKLYLLHIIIFTFVYVIFFNFYFIDQNNFIIYKNIINFNVNDIFINSGVFYVTEPIINNNFNNSIFYKFNFFYNNIFFELFSFNNFILFVVNINILFYLSVFFIVNFFKLIFKKSVYI